MSLLTNTVVSRAKSCMWDDCKHLVVGHVISDRFVYTVNVSSS